jgi:hypothetical protein
MTARKTNTSTEPTTAAARPKPAKKPRNRKTAAERQAALAQKNPQKPAPGTPHEPTDEGRELARTLSGYGIPQKQIALLLGIALPTLHDHYRDDLDIGMANANSKIAETLFAQARNGNTAALIFWSKARMGWSEKQDITISGGDKPLEVSVQTQLVEKLVTAIEGRRTKRPDA